MPQGAPSDLRGPRTTRASWCAERRGRRTQGQVPLQTTTPFAQVTSGLAHRLMVQANPGRQRAMHSAEPEQVTSQLPVQVTSQLADPEHATVLAAPTLAVQAPEPEH